MIYFSADWHFQHKKLLECDDRPKDYQTKIIDNHIDILAPEDTLYLLGDILFQPAKHRTWLSHIMQEIPGKKILVRGNHDDEKRFPNTYWVEECGFEGVYDLYLIVEDLLLSHFPMGVIDSKRNDTRFIKEQRLLYEAFIVTGCKINIHGLTHLFESDHPDCVCVSVDHTNFAPVTLDSIRKRHQEL